MDGWMNTFFSSRMSFSPLLLSLCVCQSYEISQRRAYRTARSCKGRYSRRTHTTHAYIHIKRKNHPLTNKQTHLSDKSPVFRYLLPLYRAAVCLFVCALPYPTLPLHIIVTLSQSLLRSKTPACSQLEQRPLVKSTRPDPSDRLSSRSGRKIYTLIICFSVGRVQTDGEKRKERKGKGREGGFHERENKNGYG